MTTEQLKRVMWRMRQMEPDTSKLHNWVLWRAIVLEIGYDLRTIHRIRRVLLQLGWIKSDGRNHIVMTNKDMEEG